MRGLLEFTEVILRISMKFVFVFIAGFVALIAALTWKK
jgi:hypothetical protein